jgi:EAL domain-containing protein (putative c-di-GMP-specific phosphodiesterase class I)
VVSQVRESIGERYLEEVAQALRETGADPTRLIFEASEQLAVTPAGTP